MFQLSESHVKHHRQLILAHWSSFLYLFETNPIALLRRVYSMINYILF